MFSLQLLFQAQFLSFSPTPLTRISIKVILALTTRARGKWEVEAKLKYKTITSVFFKVFIPRKPALNVFKNFNDTSSYLEVKFFGGEPITLNIIGDLMVQNIVLIKFNAPFFLIKTLCFLQSDVYYIYVCYKKQLAQDPTYSILFKKSLMHQWI